MLQFAKLIILVVTIGCTYAKLPLEDAKATVNELFTYKLDPKDFPGGVKVQEANKPLPSWLEYDEKRNELIGVPTKKDKGTWILTANQEMFAVTVLKSTKLHLAQPINDEETTVCNSNDPVTVVYVKINADVDSMASKDKAELVSRLSSHLQLKPHHIQLSSRPADLQDSSKALVSGSGDSPANDDSLGVISWIVGCGPVTSRHVEILEKIESSAKDGSMSSELEQGVSGWQVQSNQPHKITKRRLKRNVHVTATPTPADTTAATTTIRSSTTERERTTPTKAENKAPTVNGNVVPSHINAFGGQLVKWNIPANLFIDPEGMTIHLSVKSLTGEKRWVVMNNQVVGLASTQLQGEEVLRLTATDAGGLTNSVDLKVRHEATFDRFPQEYTLKISETDDLQDPISDIYMALTLEKIAPFKDLVLSYVMRDGERSVITVVAGDNRGILNSCPMKSNKRTLTALHNAVGKTKPLVGVDEGQLHIISIERVKSLAPCEEGKPQVNERELKQFKPLKVNLGELYESTIPVNLFTDTEDVDLSRMALSLLVNGIVKSDGWISLDEKTRRLQAFTWDMPGSVAQFTLEATDSSGSSTEEEIEVEVVDNTERTEINVVTLHLVGKYSTFANTHHTQVDFYRKVAKAFPNAVVKVLSVKKGSIIVQFALFPSDESSPKPEGECPSKAMDSYQEVLYDDAAISRSFINTLHSYKLEQVDFVGSGPCEDLYPPRTARLAPSKSADPPKNNTIIIVVIVIITVIIIIIIVIVVVCMRKRKAEKAAVTRQNNGNDIEKRVPVVMDEEMKSLDRPENEPLMTGADESYKPTPPAYPGDDDYQPDTPPLSEPDDEHRIVDRSL